MKTDNPYRSPATSPANINKRAQSQFLRVLGLQVIATLLCVLEGRTAWLFSETLVAVLAVSLFVFPIVVIALTVAGREHFGMRLFGLLVSAVLSVVQWLLLLPTFS